MQAWLGSQKCPRKKAEKKSGKKMLKVQKVQKKSALTGKGLAKSHKKKGFGKGEKVQKKR